MVVPYSVAAVKWNTKWQRSIKEIRNSSIWSIKHILEYSLFYPHSSHDRAKPEVRWLCWWQLLVRMSCPQSQNVENQQRTHRSHFYSAALLLCLSAGRLWVKGSLIAGIQRAAPATEAWSFVMLVRQRTSFCPDKMWGNLLVSGNYFFTSSQAFSAGSYCLPGTCSFSCMCSEKAHKV